MHATNCSFSDWGALSHTNRETWLLPYSLTQIPSTFGKPIRAASLAVVKTCSVWEFAVSNSLLWSWSQLSCLCAAFRSSQCPLGDRFAAGFCFCFWCGWIFETQEKKTLHIPWVKQIGEYFRYRLKIFCRGGGVIQAVIWRRSSKTECGSISIWRLEKGPSDKVGQTIFQGSKSHSVDLEITFLTWRPMASLFKK